MSVSDQTRGPGSSDLDPLAAYEASLTSDRILPGFGDGETAFIYHRPPLPPLRLLVPDASIQQLFAHRQWRAGLRMAGYIADGVIDLSDQTVLEVGAGTGLPGILSTLKGARKTVLTDYDDPKLLKFLRINVATCIPETLSGKAKVVGHIWGQDTEDLSDLAGPSNFTRILCADVLWDAFSHPSLIKTLSALLSTTDPDARIIVISGLHTGRGPLASFLRRAAARGLVPDEALGLKEIEVGGEVREWDESRPDGDIRDRNRWTLEFQLKRKNPL